MAEQRIAADPPRPADVQEQQRQAARESAAHQDDTPMTTTVDGGAYLVGGVRVDCNGKPLKDKD